MQCQSPQCTNPIHPERLASQPNTRTCGNPECKRLYHNEYMKDYRQRRGDELRESNRDYMREYRKRKG